MASSIAVKVEKFDVMPFLSSGWPIFQIIMIIWQIINKIKFIFLITFRMSRANDISRVSRQRNTVINVFIFLTAILFPHEMAFILLRCNDFVVLNSCQRWHLHSLSFNVWMKNFHAIRFNRKRLRGFSAQRCENNSSNYRGMFLLAENMPFLFDKFFYFRIIVRDKTETEVERILLR